MHKKRVVLLDGADRRVFPSVSDAAKFCGSRPCNLVTAMKAGRIFKGLPFVYENEDLIPRGYRIGRHSNRPIAKKVSEFRGGDLHRVYPSLSAAAREMGVGYRQLEAYTGRRPQEPHRKGFQLCFALG